MDLNLFEEQKHIKMYGICIDELTFTDDITKEMHDPKYGYNIVEICEDIVCYKTEGVGLIWQQVNDKYYVGIIPLLPWFVEEFMPSIRTEEDARRLILDSIQSFVTNSADDIMNRITYVKEEF